ncbi:hypothetical protein A2673_02105 [Candidatus Kaiserbacteria bacterium RIFCSPHIGHO2_01_FULL_50_13]|uniref:Uncharacterized protein n=1 Tax=Candidatus Kaiserbacteria bacterium RIFCSPLOWO2_01_FULL_50_24 TaxID=1798507 RepID=A0A1F6ER04_9BACT|nr:MAG: hypothetical protein A2673_02105 [Candidatus Kaiserbacteria bacterium RIFCSPHIGHO2_01_FULL_50_13]OGG76054.1 MAG: hypothetical protein A3A34_00440 [Candidatus Kaiserbacteria bacterium RIFCSPLOWO2_01_FULL_50_24]OGG81683.1 MAG: hypothetical protein A3H74_02740 [Candidatus Kaiserbacteria bacterium RIFCSPLOWO2_02_FULL_51_13]
MIMDKKTLLGVVMGVVVLAIIFLAATFYLQGYKGNLSVIYLANGDLYVGTVTTFPRLTLHEGYQFQTSGDASTPQSRLVPLSEASWAPGNLHFSKSQIVFYGPLRESSTIYKAIKDKESAVE